MAIANRNTVVGVFADDQTARDVVDDLMSQGFRRENVHTSSEQDWATEAATGGAGLTGRAPSEHHGEGIMGWFRHLFGADSSDDETGRYAEAVQRGNWVVAVDTDDTGENRAAGIMNEHGAIDIDKQTAGGYRDSDLAKPDDAIGKSDIRDRTEVSNAPGRRGDAQGDTRSVPVIQEELQVGKRVIQRGGVRVYTRVVDQPVEEQVTLREEKVRVDRRPANRPVTQADQGALRDQTIEVTETAEEPVISKQRRVVEEVVVGKEAKERTETVRDKVQRTEVEVEQLGGERGREGPAYDYGYRMAGDPNYKGRGFEDVESDLKTDYLRNNPNSKWDEARAAVRRGWEKVTGKR